MQAQTEASANTLDIIFTACKTDKRQKTINQSHCDRTPEPKATTGTANSAPTAAQPSMAQRRAPGMTTAVRNDGQQLQRHGWRDSPPACVIKKQFTSARNKLARPYPWHQKKKNGCVTSVGSVNTPVTPVTPNTQATKSAPRTRRRRTHTVCTRRLHGVRTVRTWICTGTAHGEWQKQWSQWHQAGIDRSIGKHLKTPKWYRVPLAPM
jgi:hypothetical protein